MQTWFFKFGIANGLGEGNLWIQPWCRFEEGWAIPGYACSKHATSIAPRRPNYITGPVRHRVFGFMLEKVNYFSFTQTNLEHYSYLSGSPHDIPRLLLWLFLRVNFTRKEILRLDCFFNHCFFFTLHLSTYKKPIDCYIFLVDWLNLTACKHV